MTNREKLHHIDDVLKEIEETSGKELGMASKLSRKLLREVISDVKSQGATID